MDRKERNNRFLDTKLQVKGPASLSDAELLSVIFRTGIPKQKTALELSEEILRTFEGNLTELGKASFSRLRMTAGMGETKAVVLAAVMEISKRCKMEESVTIQTVTSKEHIIALFKPMLSELPYEEFWALFLGASNKIIDRIKISQGGTSVTIVDNRLIIKRALDKLASSVIIVHNHPSGNPEPSAKDIELTERLDEALALLDIRLMDHIIVTYGECFSFRANNLL